MRFLGDGDRVKVALVGVGYIGSCVAATLAEGQAEVVGVDTDETLVAELAAGRCRFNEHGLAEALGRGLSSGRLRVTTDFDAVAWADVLVVTVGTPITGDGELDESQLQAACQQIAPRLRRGQLVILKSTVPPGTVRSFLVPILEQGGLKCGEDFGVAFSPERISEGKALAELRSLPIVVGGWCADSAAATQAFWSRMLGVPVIPLESLEAAEIVKLADNWWIDLNIAMGNELARYCSVFGVDVLDVIAAANSIPKGAGMVNILMPSVGVGGSCLTKDPWMMWRSARERGIALRTIETARAANEGMPDYSVRLITDELTKLGKDPSTARIAVLGLAYKNDTSDLRMTPTLPAVRALRALGAEVRAHDPLADPDEVERMFGLRPYASLEEAVEGADCLAVLALHRPFESIDFARLRGLVNPACLVFDGRAYYPRQTIQELRELGFAYRGIGR
uniref:Putative UDP-N-acetyl-D-mannosaminuronic acid dehydrogenase n=1 Tax=Actinomadura melliaura TaxID=360723 RepID=Q0H2W3_9ACTN|nr:putative UDP-N-acetyl-D-mannosaminuronic acid dehydrogenase [Actinomadura melliaura]